jgi:DNA-directed RNA polymerase specialized sigma24 family protein
VDMGTYILWRTVSCPREREQQAITLYYAHGLTLRQIADRTDVHESHVSQVHSASLLRSRFAEGTVSPYRADADIDGNMA